MTINIVEQGADPAFKRDSTPYFKEAFSKINDIPLGGGLVIEIPGGEYMITETLVLPPGIALRGVGPINGTRLNFKYQQRGPGILMDYPNGSVMIEGINIENTQSTGLEIRTVVKDASKAHCQFKNIKVVNAGASIDSQGGLAQQLDEHGNPSPSADIVRLGDSGANGFYCENLWMSQFENCWAKNSRKFGFYFSGFHTSLTLNNCYADLSGDTGFYINSAIYTNLITCASDGSRQGYGYFFTNCEGVSMIGCGAEVNYYSAIGLEANNKRAVQAKSTRGKIEGMTINSFFSKHGNESKNEAFGHYLTIISDDEKVIEGSSHNHFAYPSEENPVPSFVKRGESKHQIDFPIYKGSKVLSE